MSERYEIFWVKEIESIGNMSCALHCTKGKEQKTFKMPIKEVCGYSIRLGDPLEIFEGIVLGVKCW